MTSSLHDLASTASLYAPLTEVHAERVRALAARSLSDPDIGRELGLSKKQVERIRRVNDIDAGVSGGGQSRPVPEVPVCDRPRSLAHPDSANARWCAMLERADSKTWNEMRRAVCWVLRLGSDTTDQALICAAQRDPRTSEELARAYLTRFGGRS